MSNFPKGYKEPPFGITVLWGKRKVGKTIAALNSPWLPVHVIDVEFSAKDYEDNFEMMKELGILKNPFTRASCLVQDDFFTEFERITDKESDVHYGTIILDTVGQITEWTKTSIFARAGDNKVAKMSQIVWGDVRSSLRNMLLQLQMKSDLIVMTAHEREYAGVKSPRANPTILELASMSIHLEKRPNQQIPDGIVDIARLPVYPPRIPEFTIAKLLTYHKKPADWDNLSEDEQVENSVPVIEEEEE
jgi:hypothetical protein